MDLCWAWSDGCSIDWLAVGAIFTAFAAIVALVVAGSEKRTRQRRELAESKVIAQLLAYSMHRDRDRLVLHEDIVDVHNKSGGRAANLLANDQARRARLMEHVGGVASGMREIERMEGRLYVLDQKTSRSIMDAYTSAQRLAESAKLFRDIAEDTALDDKIALAEHLRSQYIDAMNAFYRARRLCIEASLYTPMTLRTLLKQITARRPRKRTVAPGTPMIGIPVNSDGSFKVSGEDILKH